MSDTRQGRANTLKTNVLNVEVFDLDGTITRKDTYVPYLIYVLIRRPGRWITIPMLAMGVVMFKTKVRDNTWLKSFFLYHVLGGLHKNKAVSYAHGFVKSFLPVSTRRKALSTIKKQKAENRYLILMSASLDLYVDIIGKALGFDTIICTQTQLDKHGIITGKLKNGNCYGPAKLNRLKSLQKHFPNALFTVYTDHHSDIPIIKAADKAIAVNPDKKLKKYTLDFKMLCQDWS